MALYAYWITVEVLPDGDAKPAEIAASIGRSFIDAIRLPAGLVAYERQDVSPAIAFLRADDGPVTLDGSR